MLVTLKKFAQQGFYKSYYSQQLNTWTSTPKSEEKDSNRPPCVTFYSYKGGVGRSTALAVVARLLAKEGITVAVIDLDLEAPGLNSLLLTRSKPSPFGVVDYLYHAPWVRDKISEKKFLQRYMVREEVPIKNKKAGQLYVMAAGGTQVHAPDGQQLLFDDEIELVLEPHYLQKLSYIDVDLYSRGSTNAFAMLIEDVAKYTKADIILLDARTGLSNVSGLLLNHFSDIISIHIQDNWQNREGIKLILDAVNKDQLKNMIWSNTKVSRGEDQQKELERLILHEMRSKLGDRDEGDWSEIDVNLHKLPFDAGLEGATAYDLKRYIDQDQISVLYKELVDSIIGMTDLSVRLPYHITTGDYKRVIDELKYLAKSQKVVPYISQRFLNEDYEIFVSFPGSGKSVFKEYMNNHHRREVQVMDYHEFQKQKLGTHEILSRSVFLHWNYQEATQAVCKWMLHSKVLFEWVMDRIDHFDNVTDKDFENMRDNPEYELPEKVAESIVELIFQKNSGWRSFFGMFIHTDVYVLPDDLMLGLRKFFEIVKFNDWRRPWLMGDFAGIGERKKNWLKTYNEDLLHLIMIYNSVPGPQVGTSKLDLGFVHVSYDEMKNTLSFTEAITEGARMGILSVGFTNHEIEISPVYRFIERIAVLIEVDGPFRGF